MNDELRAAIANKTITGLTYGLWYLEAKQGCAVPYGVFTFVNNNPSRDTSSKFEDYYVQITLYHSSASSLETLQKALTAAFDDSESSFSLASYHFTRIERQFSRPLKVEKIYQIVTQYKIELTKK